MQLSLPRVELTLLYSLKEEVVGRKVHGVAPVINDVLKELLLPAVVQLHTQQLRAHLKYIFVSLIFMIMSFCPVLPCKHVEDLFTQE